MKLSLIFLTLTALLTLSSCLDDNEVDYTQWRADNEKFITDAEAETKDGVKVYTRLTPPWAPSTFVLATWLNDRSENADELIPLDNSLVHVKYALDDINGNRISDSYSNKTYGDGIYQTRPNQNIFGFWYVLTRMRKGDHVKCVMPATAAYGDVTYGSIPPYSTLVYDIELVDIKAYEVPL